MTDYTLPTFEYFGDTYTVKFIDAVDGLVALVPATTNIISMENKVEQMEASVPEYGMIIPENIRLSFVDDTGFFNSLFVSNCDIKITRESECEYYGYVVADLNVSFSEWYVSGTTAMRNVTFMAIAMINKMKDYTAKEIVDFILDEGDNGISVVQMYEPPNFPNDRAIRVSDLFAAFMIHCFSTPTSSGGINPSRPTVDNEDFAYYDSTSTLTAFADLGIGYPAVGDTPPFILNPLQPTYFDSTKGDYWGDNYDSALDLLTALAASFGFLPRVYYDTTHSCWRLQLKTRRKNSYTAANMPLYLAGSDKKPKSFNPSNYRFTFSGEILQEITPPVDLGAYAEESWLAKGEIHNNEIAEDVVSFDVDTRIFYYPLNYYAGDMTPMLVSLAGGYNHKRICFLKYYDYATKAWSDFQDYVTSAYLNYFYKQRTTKESYERTFMGFTSNEVGSVINMHNGTTYKDYYINRFERNYSEHSETYQLIEV